MAKKTKGEWPYHEDPHGNWIACSIKPCKLHSGGDIMATSPEDAFAKADGLAHPQGGDGLTDSKNAASMDKGAKEARAAAMDWKTKSAKADEAMEGFYKKPLDDVPEHLKRPGWVWAGEVGGKYAETRHMFKGQVAKLIRHDIAQFRKAGGMPKDWKVKVMVCPKTLDKYNNSDFYIIVTRPSGSTPAERDMRPSDICDPNADGSKISRAVDFMRRKTGSDDCTYDQAVEFCRNYPGPPIITSDKDITESRLNDIGRQYRISAENANGYIYEHGSRVIFIDEDNKDWLNDNDRMLQYFMKSRRGRKPSSAEPNRGEQERKPDLETEQMFSYRDETTGETYHIGGTRDLRRSLENRFSRNRRLGKKDGRAYTTGDAINALIGSLSKGNRSVKDDNLGISLEYDNK